MKKIQNRTLDAVNYLGGRRVLAQKLNISVAAINRWIYDNRISNRHIFDVLDLCEGSEFGLADLRPDIAAMHKENKVAMVMDKFFLARPLHECIGISRQAVARWRKNGRVPRNRVELVLRHIPDGVVTAAELTGYQPRE